MAREYFGQMVRLRAHAYGPKYPIGFLPVDTPDYFVWHHLLCVEDGDAWLPVAGFRQVPLSRCDLSNATIPLLRTAQDANAERHVRNLSETFARHRSQGTEVTYSAGLAIAYEHRGNKELSEFVREFVAAFHVLDQREHSIRETVCASILRFKTNTWFTQLGYQPLSDEQGELPAIKKVSAGGEPMLFMSLKELSPWCFECFEKLESLVNGRLLIRTQPVQEEKMAA